MFCGAGSAAAVLVPPTKKGSSPTVAAALACDRRKCSPMAGFPVSRATRGLFFIGGRALMYVNCRGSLTLVHVPGQASMVAKCFVSLGNERTQAATGRCLESAAVIAWQSAHMFSTEVCSLLLVLYGVMRSYSGCSRASGGRMLRTTPPPPRLRGYFFAGHRQRSAKAYAGLGKQFSPIGSRRW